MQKKRSNKICDHSAIVLERNRYFTGKYMTARDFCGEQDYHLNRHRLHNRLLHGWGIVCGLRVKHHPDPQCAKSWVVVRSGIAIDCYGREIVLHKDTPFQLPPLPSLGKPEPSEEEYPEVELEIRKREMDIKQQEHPEEPKRQKHKPRRGPNWDDWTFLLGIQYVEKEIEPVPVLYNEDQCDPTHQEANRLLESAKLVALRWDEVSPGCWKAPGGDDDTPCHKDCDDPLPGPGGICLEPECPCSVIVPLARLVYNPNDPEAGLRIDTRGRRQLPLAPELHTHIVHINWPHGQIVALDDIEEWGRQLKIRFDRPILDGQGDATGINNFTFIVQYGGIQKDLEFMPGKAELSEDGLVATFSLFKPEEEQDDDVEYYKRIRIDRLVENEIFITLKCDFILDCHENPVDGNHLRGLLPSGNDTLGGTFESWFKVVPAKEDRKV